MTNAVAAMPIQTGGRQQKCANTIPAQKASAKVNMGARGCWTLDTRLVSRTTPSECCAGHVLSIDFAVPNRGAQHLLRQMYDALDMKGLREHVDQMGLRDPIS